MKPLSSTVYPAQGIEVRRSLGRFGYVHLPAVIDLTFIFELRHKLAKVLEKFDLLDPTKAADQLFVRSGVYLDASHAAYREVQRAAYAVGELHALPHSNAIVQLAHAIFGEAVITLPCHQLRISFPSRNEEAATTPWHQDYSFFQGSERTLTFWCPLHTCDLDRGPICVASNRHREGELPFGLSPSGEFNIASTFEGQEHAGTICEGDLVVFTAFTPHKALPNISRCIRISLDFRIQPLGDPAAELMFGQFCPGVDQRWEAIYAGSDIPAKLRYYWRNQPLRLHRHDSGHFYRQVELAISHLESGDSCGELFLRCIVANDGLPSLIKQRIERALVDR